MSTENRIRDFIVNELHWRGDRAELTADYPLIEGGVLDSLGIFEIVSFLESSFGVELADEDLVPENFATIGSIGQLVAKKPG